MSKLVADNLRAMTAGVETPMQYPVRGSAKVTCAYNLSIATPTLSDSFNVSSLTDNGTGDATINFASAMSASAYTTSGAQTNVTTSADQYMPHPRQLPDILVGSLRMYSVSASNTLFDYAYTSAVVYGMIA